MNSALLNPHPSEDSPKALRWQRRERLQRPLLVVELGRDFVGILARVERAPHRGLQVWVLARRVAGVQSELRAPLALPFHLVHGRDARYVLR